MPMDLLARALDAEHGDSGIRPVFAVVVVEFIIIIVIIITIVIVIIIINDRQM